MMPRVAGIAIIAFAFGLEAARADPYSLSQHELDVIRVGLSEQMLDPTSTIVSDVISVTKGKFEDTGATVCGMVRGRNTFGGYAPPTPFIGVLADTSARQRTFLPIAIADPSPTSQLAVLQMCKSEISAGSTPRLSIRTEPVRAKDWNDCIRKLCISTTQGDCWIKAGTDVCADDGSCTPLPDHTPAIIDDQKGETFHVSTEVAEGWVSARMMMLHGPSCSF